MQRIQIYTSKEIPGLISFRMDWLNLLAVQGTLKSLLQHHSSKASILQCSAFFTVQLSHPYMTTGKNHSLDYALDNCMLISRDNKQETWKGLLHEAYACLLLLKTLWPSWCEQLWTSLLMRDTWLSNTLSSPTSPFPQSIVIPHPEMEPLWWTEYCSA